MNLTEIFERLYGLLEDGNMIKVAAELKSLEPYDIAEFFGECSTAQLVRLFRLLPKALAAEIFVEMDADLQETLIEAFSDKELKAVLDELFFDDTVDIIEEMPASVVMRIIKNSSPEARREINELLKYPSDSAGSIMTTEFVRLKRTMTVADAFETIRKTGVDKETVYTCYVTESDRTLVGVVTVKDLLLAKNEDRVEDIMEENVVYAETHDDRESAARMLGDYGFLALPVVDTERRLVGIVTVDDAIEVLEEEASEDIEVMAAITPTDKPYMKTGVFEMWKKRIPWLLILMLSATFTGLIITSFEDALAATVVLTAFIPMLMGTGGNAGSQASVTVIRALSLGDVELSSIGRVIWKELRVAVLCGATLAAASFAKVMLIDGMLAGNPDVTAQVALVVAVTIFVEVIIAKIVGCALPILAKSLKLDPAVMASPFITTIVDAVSLIIYFSVAKTIIVGII